MKVPLIGTDGGKLGEIDILPELAEAVVEFGFRLGVGLTLDAGVRQEGDERKLVEFRVT